MKQNSTTSVCTATSSWGGSDNQHVDSFSADLHKQRYAGDTIRRYLGIIRNFSLPGHTLIMDSALIM